MTPWTAAHQASLSLNISQSLPKFVFIALVMPSSHLIFWHSSPSALNLSQPTGSFPMSHLFMSDDKNTGASASASVLPANILGWSPLRLTGLISLLSEGFAEVFFSTTVWGHWFFGILSSSQSSSSNHWDDHSLDYTDLCRQSNVSAF